LKAASGVNDVFYEDVTGDLIPELFFFDFNLFPQPHILMCDKKNFKAFLLPVEQGSVEIYSIQDFTKNNIPEIILTYSGCSGSGCFGIDLVEWDGQKFVDLSPEVSIWGLKEFKFDDTNQDGFREIILTGDRPGSCCEADMLPWRFMSIVYSWNGSKYEETYKTFDPPIYRFQALQDADGEVLYKHYDKALNFYQDVIFSHELNWWSPELRQYEREKYYAGHYDSNNPTLSPAPNEDPTEYPRLAAYAYYRMVILHTYLGEMEAAQIQYATLQEKFPTGNPGQPYAEMATDFWKAYQSSGKIYNACAAAIAFADAHPEILTPLGSDYHGAQSHIYVPAEVCPLR
jgi:hypothetical protein